MATSQADFQLEYVSEHIDQTRLVNELLHDGTFGYEEIFGWHADENECYPEIYQWKVFPHFGRTDYDRLVDAKIPVLENNLGTWVGLTSW